MGIAGIGLATACGTAASAADGPAAAPAATSQNATSQNATSPSGTISEAGSTLLEPLMQKWATAYHQQYPGATVNVASPGGGSTKGITDAENGSVAIGASDAYLSSGDLLQHPSLLNIPLAVSAQSVIYNLPSLQGTHINLNGMVLAGMYNGSITTWDDPAIRALNPGVSLPPTRVVPVHRSTGSGDTFIFTSYLSTQDPAWSQHVGYGTQVAWSPLATAQAVSSSTTMISTCARFAGCIGYNGISYLPLEQAKGLGEAALENSRGNFEIPSATTIDAELNDFVGITPDNETISMIAGPAPGGYPIINFEYAIVTTSQPSAGRATAVRDFLNWVVSSSSALSLVGSVGFQPLPGDVRQLSLDQIARIH